MSEYNAELNKDSRGVKTPAEYNSGTSQWEMPGKIADGSDVTQGAKADTAVVDPTAAATEIALLKGIIKQLQGDGTAGKTAPVEVKSSTIPDTQPVPVNMVTSLSKDVDSIDVAKLSKGGVITPTELTSISATTTSNELTSCEGFNAILVEATVSNITSGNWVIELQGALTAGGTVGQYIDTLGISSPALTNKHISPLLNANGVYIIIFKGIANYNKLVCTRTTDGTLSIKVQPLNL